MRTSWQHLVIALLACLTSACAVQPPVGQPPVWQPPVRTQCAEAAGYQVTFCLDDSLFANPERGFHVHYEMLSGTQVYIPDPYPDVTLVRGYVELDDWRNTPELPQELLDRLQRDFASLRQAGAKVILRFAYNRGPGSTEDGAIGLAAEAPLELKLQHIRQLAPVLAANSDVIATLQAGFIGYWGEWHRGHSGDVVQEREKHEVAVALLDALPDSRMIQIRTPYHVRHVLGHNRALEPGLAFGTSAQARIGFMNDCFLSGRNDVGTYDGAQDRSYAASMGVFTVTGGETCSEAADPPARQECSNAISELQEYGWDYINLDFYAPVIAGWSEGDCLGEIRRRLGYRFELLGASIEPTGENGAMLVLGIHNSGFGKLYNPRPLELVLVNGAERHTMPLSPDARLVLPLAGETRHHLLFELTGLPAGTWQLELVLPDAAASLRNEPAFSIRFASRDSAGDSVWNPVTGSNRLGLSLVIAPD